MYSIIIPLYNKAPYVEKALKSVLNQTFQEFEVIVVDDGSTDKSLDIVEHFNKSVGQRLNIVSQKNQGVSTARNNGVKLANYPYICFLDADDWWAPTFLEEMKNLIEEYPDAGIYGSSYYKVKKGEFIPANIGVEKGFRQGLINYCKVYAKTLWMPLWTGAVIIPKQVYKELNGFKAELKLGEDFDLWIRIVLKYSVAFLNKPLAYYNQDVEVQNRAIGKLYSPDTQFAFNIDEITEEEEKNPDLKYLLDMIRITCLKTYYLSREYREVAKEELEKVDLEAHKKRNYATYLRRPIWVTKIINRVYYLYKKIK